MPTESETITPSPEINWQRNLLVVWIGCFLTGQRSACDAFFYAVCGAIRRNGHRELNLWSGFVFSITFSFFRTIAAPFWGGLADRYGREIHVIAFRPWHGDYHGADGFAQISGNFSSACVIRRFLAALS